MLLAMAQEDNLGLVFYLILFIPIALGVAFYFARVKCEWKAQADVRAFEEDRLFLLVKGLEVLVAAYEQDRADMILTHKKCKSCGSKKHVDEVVPVEALDGRTVPMCEDCRSMIGD